MNRRTNSLLPGLALGMALLLAAGCAATRPAEESDDSTRDFERISGGIAAIAGEAAGAEDTVTNEDAEGRSLNFTAQMLQGQVAGVRVLELPGGGFSVRIRGKSSLLANTEPLYVVDGMQILNRDSQGLAWLNIHDIQKIVVLKDASATALYGTRGSNGVVLITTKRGPRD